MPLSNPSLEARELDEVCISSPTIDAATTPKEPEKEPPSIALENAPSEASSVSEHFDTDAVRRLRTKIDWRLLPLVSVLYLCSFLDRVNIGNAKVAGIVQDLGLTPNEFSWALSIFFIGYVLFEVPSNICLKLVGPRRWITFIMIAWGGIMMAMAAAKNAAGLLSARFFLGVAECGLFPGVVYLFSLWYTKNEQALRNGIFFSSATMAGAFGGILAYGIEHMDGVAGLEGWQWIFILEGLPTVLLTIVVYLRLPDFPETATFLTPEERELTIQRLKVDAGPATQTDFSWRQCRLAFTDWKVYMHMLIYICHTTCLFSFALFLPSIVVGFHFDPVTTQIMTAPAYAVACIATIYCAFSSDRHKERGFHLASAGATACLGYLLLIATKNSSTAARYVCLTITSIGNFSTLPPMVSWFSSNIGGHTKRGVATAAIISFANSGGIFSGQIYRDDDLPNGYVRGHAICAAMQGTMVITTLTLKWLLTRENRRRDRLTPEEFKIEAEGEDLCDAHPGWRYWT
ncbi:major facilitator superfamily domain-containing protein [Mortierella sp. GBAus27b]|nr:hypothetical protein BGX31_004343 [Mortierella sp. GBA43]KAI8362244.1 major facilitator superfamily domain-containing protein [Mortierella sp. GBAus27b]